MNRTNRPVSSLILAIAMLMTLSSRSTLAQSALWSGVYIGGHIGGIFGSSGMRLVPGGFDTSFGPGSQPTGSLSPKGFIGGLLAGYNVRLTPNVVLGLEIEASGTSASASTITSATAGWPANNRLSEPWNARSRVRVGWASRRLMPFIAAGISVTRAVLEMELDCYGQSYRDNESKILVGFNLGAGIEYAISNNLRTRLEYIYDDYGSPQIGTIKPDWNDRKFQTFNTSTARIALSYQF